MMTKLPSNIFSVIILLLFGGRMLVHGQDITTAALEDITAYSSSIIGHIGNFHKYEYDDFIEPVTTIWNGRFNMYSVGNEVQFWDDDQDQATVAEYGHTVATATYTLSSALTYPFTLLWWIEEPPINKQSAIQVLSFIGWYDEAAYQQYNGTIRQGNFTLVYNSVQMFNASSPSLCEVYYVIHSTKSWSSEMPNNVALSTAGQPEYDFVNTFRVTGNFSKILVGYSLYSKYTSSNTGEKIEESELRNALAETLKIIVRSNSPNRPKPTTPPPAFRPEEETMVEKLMNNAELVAKNITDSIPFWFDYNYDTNDSVIEDGGNDIFDFGNRIRFKTGDENSQRAEYNKFYYFNDYQFLTRAIHPFLAFMWIENTNATLESFTLQVDGNVGADQEGGINLYSGKNISVGEFHISYEVFLIHSTEDPSVGEVYFTISSEKLWNSVDGDSLQVGLFTDETDELVNRVLVSGQPQRFLLGYMLLSKESGEVITEAEVQATLVILANSFGPPIKTPVSTIQPTTVATIEPSAPGTGGVIFQLANSLLSASETITQREIYGWHNYTYDDITPPFDSIVDGGSAMFNVGNQVSFSSGTRLVSFAEYDKVYRFADFDAISIAQHPFYAFMWIRNPTGMQQKYSIKVASNLGPGTSGMQSENNGKIRYKGIACDYHSLQVFGSSPRPSICKVYFLLESRRHWDSVDVDSFSGSFSLTNSTIMSGIEVVGSPQRVLLGYILMSRKDSALIPESKIKFSLRSIMAILDATFSIKTTSSVPTSIYTTASDDFPSKEDEEFLAQCTVKDALASLWDCQHYFSTPVKFGGAQSCKKIAGSFIECIASKIENCTFGNGTNTLDSFKIPNFDSKFLIDGLRNIYRSESTVNDPLTVFCFHAPLNLPLPHTPREVPVCIDGVIGELMFQLKSFYNTFAWAWNKQDICAGFQSLQRWVLRNSQNRCDFGSFRELRLTTPQRRYLVAVFDVATKFIQDVPIAVCEDA